MKKLIIIFVLLAITLSVNSQTFILDSDEVTLSINQVSKTLHEKTTIYLNLDEGKMRVGSSSNDSKIFNFKIMEEKVERNKAIAWCKGLDEEGDSVVIGITSFNNSKLIIISVSYNATNFISYKCEKVGYLE